MKNKNLLLVFVSILFFAQTGHTKDQWISSEAPGSDYKMSGTIDEYDSSEAFLLAQQKNLDATNAQLAQFNPAFARSSQLLLQSDLHVGHALAGSDALLPSPNDIPRTNVYSMATRSVPEPSERTAVSALPTIPAQTVPELSPAASLDKTAAPSDQTAAPISAALPLFGIPLVAAGGLLVSGAGSNRLRAVAAATMVAAAGGGSKGCGGGGGGSGVPPAGPFDRTFVRGSIQIPINDNYPDPLMHFTPDENAAINAVLTNLPAGDVRHIRFITTLPQSQQPGPNIVAENSTAGGVYVFVDNIPGKAATPTGSREAVATTLLDFANFYHAIIHEVGDQVAQAFDTETSKEWDALHAQSADPHDFVTPFAQTADADDDWGDTYAEWGTASHGPLSVLSRAAEGLDAGHTTFAQKILFVAAHFANPADHTLMTYGFKFGYSGNWTPVTGSYTRTATALTINSPGEGGDLDGSYTFNLQGNMVTGIVDNHGILHSAATPFKLPDYVDKTFKP